MKIDTHHYSNSKPPTQPQTRIAVSATTEATLLEVASTTTSVSGQEASEEPPSSAPSNALLRLPAVQKLVPLGKSTIWQAVKEDRFPAPIKIGVRAVAWRLSDIEAFMKGGAK